MVPGISNHEHARKWQPGNIGLCMHTIIRYGNRQPRHRPVLTHIDREGTTVSILAQRASIAPTAMGSFVDELERLRYVMRRAVAVGRPPSSSRRQMASA
jgi:hypothetical protein